jgi:hypothetical protein
MDIEAALARYEELVTQYLQVKHGVFVCDHIACRLAFLREIRAEAYALQFELLLHLPCRRFFKIFNIQ